MPTESIHFSNRIHIHAYISFLVQYFCSVTGNSPLQYAHFPHTYDICGRVKARDNQIKEQQQKS